MINLLNKLVKENDACAKHKNIIINEIQTILKGNSAKWSLEEDLSDNLVLKMGVGSKKIMLATNIDSLSFMITSIEDDLFARITPIGSFNMQSYVGEIINFDNNISGRLCCNGDKSSLNDLFIDFSISIKEEVENHIQIGSIGKLASSVLGKNDRIMAPNLSSRIGALAFIETIRKLALLDNLSNEIYFVFSSRKDTTSTGARTAAHDIRPDECIVLDTIGVEDVLEGKGKIKLGEGPVVSIYDRSLVIHHEIKDKLDKISFKNNEKIQYNIGNDSNEGGNVHKEAGGIKTACISIPCRYKDTSMEICDLKDIKGVTTILSDFMD